MLLAPMNGETLLLDRAMLGSTEGTDLSASGEMRIRSGRDYDTFTWNGTTYLGQYQVVPGRLADGHPAGGGHAGAGERLPPPGADRPHRLDRLAPWAFLRGCWCWPPPSPAALPRPSPRASPRPESEEQDWQPTGIREIDELTAYFHSRLREKQAEEALPRQVESLVSELTDRAKGLTGTERVILRYYAEGYTVKDISGLLFISAGTVKGHNSHIYSKLGVDSYNALKAYLDVLRRCERLEDLLQGGGK